MELKAKVRATSTRGVRSAEIDENGDLIFTMTDGETLNLGQVGPRGILSVEVLETGELKFNFNDGTSQVVGEDVYSAMAALTERAETAAEAAEEAAETLTVDDQLAGSGQVADAKAVGDAIYYRLVNNTRWIMEESNGHATYYATSAMPMQLWKEVDGVKVKDSTVRATDYIKVSSTEYVNIFLTGSNGTNIQNAACYVYFYNANKEVVWSVLDYTDPSTNIKNKVGINYLKTLNGFQFTNIPDGYYVRVAAAANTVCRVIVWDGTSFGYPVTSLPTIYDENVSKKGLPADASASIQVPSNVTYLIAKPGYTFIGLTTTTGSTTEEPAYNSSRLPAQVLYLTNMSGASRVKNVRIVKNYSYQTGEHDLVMPKEDLSDYVVAIDVKKWEAVRSAGYANNKVLDKIKSVFNVDWTAVKPVVEHSGSYSFKQGVKYRGIPYRSSWTTASCPGWHITRHTFINAANDPDSIFYNNPSARKPGPYYSLVCSQFASLVTGFLYPYSNWGLMHSPDVLVQKSEQPQIGKLMSNGFGHCVVPIEYNTSVSDNYALTIAEQAGTYTRLFTIFDGVSDSWSGIGAASSYISPYQWGCAQASWDSDSKATWLNQTPYSLTNGTIRNGNARPYLGDRCVFTSAMSVKINIKDTTANRLYYQKFDVTATHGVPGTFTPNGDPAYIDITPGTTQVTLRSATGNGGTFTGVALEDGAVYGVWASVDDAQTSAPSNVEYFEWRDVYTNSISFDVVDGVLKTNAEFWYAITNAINHQKIYGMQTVNGVQRKIVNGNMTIPYNPPAKTINGVPLGSSDYSRYAELAYIPYAESVYAFFRKGKFGAYVVGKEIEDQSDEETDPVD